MVSSCDKQEWTFHNLSLSRVSVPHQQEVLFFCFLFTVNFQECNSVESVASCRWVIAPCSFRAHLKFKLSCSSLFNQQADVLSLLCLSGRNVTKAVVGELQEIIPALMFAAFWIKGSLGFRFWIKIKCILYFSIFLWGKNTKKHHDWQLFVAGHVTKWNLPV